MKINSPHTPPLQSGEAKPSFETAIKRITDHPLDHLPQSLIDQIFEAARIEGIRSDEALKAVARIINDTVAHVHGVRIKGMNELLYGRISKQSEML